MQHSPAEPLSRLDRTHPCWRAGHDDIEVFQNQKLIEFLKNHAGWVKHEADIAFLSNGIVDHQFHAELIVGVGAL